MPAVAALAAFTHHVMVTAMMLPILQRHARERQLPASRLLMPMSLAASLGTTLTLVSAPAFLLASDMLDRTASSEGLVIFDINPIGIQPEGRREGKGCVSTFKSRGAAYH